MHFLQEKQHYFYAFKSSKTKAQFAHLWLQHLCTFPANFNEMELRFPCFHSTLGTTAAQLLHISIGVWLNDVERSTAG